MSEAKSRVGAGGGAVGGIFKGDDFNDRSCAATPRSVVDSVFGAEILLAERVFVRDPIESIALELRFVA